MEREVRIWDIKSGKFIRKIDFSVTTNEAITSIKMTGSGILLVGSKDSNIYHIDTTNGKVNVVYQGHWSRITLTYLVPGKDILISVSESNIKVWDLQYDECIQNMNEHSAPVVLCRVSSRDCSNIITISQNHEYKLWNYTTGKVVR